MKKPSKVQFYKGLPPDGALVKWFKPQDHGILVLDDLMEESSKKTNACWIYLPKILTIGVLQPRILHKIYFRRQIC